MTSGKISIVESEHSELEALYNEVSAGDTPFESFSETLIIDEEIHLDNNRTAYKGRAAVEDVDEVQQKKVLGQGQIEYQETLEKIVRTTEFLFIPDSFLIVENTAGEFILPLLNRNTEHSVFDAKIDLYGYSSEFEDVNHWKVGFEERTDSAENGVIHGDKILQDPEIGNLLGKTQKNQIGIEHPMADDIAKVFVTKSGYLELYQPDLTTREFIQYLESNVIQHLKIK